MGQLRRNKKSSRHKPRRSSNGSRSVSDASSVASEYSTDVAESRTTSPSTQSCKPDDLKNIRRALTATIVSFALIKSGVKFVKRQRARQESNIAIETITNSSLANISNHTSNVSLSELLTHTQIPTDPKCKIPFSHLFSTECRQQIDAKPLFSIEDILNIMSE